MKIFASLTMLLLILSGCSGTNKYYDFGDSPVEKFQYNLMTLEKGIQYYGDSNAYVPPLAIREDYTITCLSQFPGELSAQQRADEVFEHAKSKYPRVLSQNKGLFFSASDKQKNITKDTREKTGCATTIKYVEIAKGKEAVLLEAAKSDLLLELFKTNLKNK